MSILYSSLYNNTNPIPVNTSSTISPIMNTATLLNQQASMSVGQTPSPLLLNNNNNHNPYLINPLPIPQLPSTVNPQITLSPSLRYDKDNQHRISPFIASASSSSPHHTPRFIPTSVKGKKIHTSPRKSSMKRISSPSMTTTPITSTSPDTLAADEKLAKELAQQEILAKKSNRKLKGRKCYNTREGLIRLGYTVQDKCPDCKKYTHEHVLRANRTFDYTQFKHPPSPIITAKIPSFGEDKNISNQSPDDEVMVTRAVNKLPKPPSKSKSKIKFTAIS